MKMCLITNSVSPHQLPLAKCLVDCLGDGDFRYISTGRLTDERKKLGWESNDIPQWVLQPAENSNKQQEVLEWSRNADIVLCGNRNIELFKKRVHDGRITFYMSERWFKPPWGVLRMLHPGYLKKCLEVAKLLESRFFYYLPMGFYAATDMRRVISLFKAKPNHKPITSYFHLWGYFVGLSMSAPCFKHDHSGRIEILWFGRFLKWKRVDLLIKAVSQMDETLKIKIHVRIIGIGPQESVLRNMVEKYALSTIIEFLPPKPIDEIRVEIRKADICVVTSNAQEGWGVSVNEIMAEESCLIASDASGAGATLIRHGKNGLLYKSGSVKDLLKQLNLVCKDLDFRLKLSQEACQTIKSEWSPEVAAERLIEFSNSILAGKLRDCNDSGPLSKI